MSAQYRVVRHRTKWVLAAVSWTNVTDDTRGPVPEQRDVIAELEVLQGHSLCQHGMPQPGLRILDIARTKGGWHARGHYQSVTCMYCSMVYQAVVERVPIECAAFECPDCGPGSNMTSDVLRVSEADSGYVFEATLRCDRCSRPTRLRKTLNALTKIKRVKLGPSGVELERSE